MKERSDKVNVVKIINVCKRKHQETEKTNHGLNENT